MAVFWPWSVEFLPFFQIFLQITSKHAQKIILKNQKISFTRKISKLKNCENDQKRTKNGWFFLALEGKVLTFFHNFFQITSRYAQKHHIKKSKKFIHQKNFKVRKTAKMAKNCRFWPLEVRILTLFSQFFANHF